MAGRPPIAVNVQIDADRTEAAFKQARKELNAKVKAGIKDAGERIALPAAKAKMPGSLAAMMAVKSTARQGYLTGTNKKAKAILGVYEFGGQVGTVIRPKKAKALRLRDGSFVSIVRGPRTYKNHGYMYAAIKDNQDRIDEAIRGRIMEAFGEFETS